MAIKMNVETIGKRDALGFHPRDLVANFAAFTGRDSRTEAAIKAMMDSLLAEGQLQPILYRKSFDGKPIPIAGYTRIIAADRINREGLGGYSQDNPFVIYGIMKTVSDLEAVLMTYRENDDETRTAVTPIDRALTVRVLRENYGLFDAEIASKLRKSPVWVQQHLELLCLDEGTKSSVASGELGVSAAMTLSKVAPEDRAAVVELAREASKGNRGGRKKTEVTERAVAQAARQSGAATAKPIRRKATDLVRFMNVIKGNTPEGAAYDFLTGVDEFMAGTIDEDALLALFGVIREG